MYKYTYKAKLVIEIDIPEEYVAAKNFETLKEQFNKFPSTVKELLDDVLEFQHEGCNVRNTINVESTDLQQV